MKRFIRKYAIGSKYDTVVWEEELELKSTDIISMKLLKVGESLQTLDPFIILERIEND
tara:strand:- start:1469 stop:1642 length:174 start_codon:yes stop_codon:yes gene_type:complete